MNDAVSLQCPYCGEAVELNIDEGGGVRQEYVEDCPVCCNPNLVHVTIDEDGTPTVWAEAEQDRS